MPEYKVVSGRVGARDRTYKKGETFTMNQSKFIENAIATGQLIEIHMDGETIEGPTTDPDVPLDKPEPQTEDPKPVPMIIPEPVPATIDDELKQAIKASPKTPPVKKTSQKPRKTATTNIAIDLSKPPVKEERPKKTVPKDQPVTYM